MKWLEDGKDILVVVYEKLNTLSLNKTLHDISDFLDRNIDGDRLECTILHSEGKFHRKQKCIAPKFRDDNITDYLVSENHTITKDIFSNENRLKINTAIENVNMAMLKRGLDNLPLQEYKETIIQLNLCSS